MDCRERGGSVDYGPGVLCDARASKFIWVLAQKSGNAAFAQSAEELTYNAMLGSRNRSGTALAYGTLDNCYTMDGHHHENGERTAIRAINIRQRIVNRRYAVFQTMEGT